MIEKNILASIDQVAMTGITPIGPTKHSVFHAGVVAADLIGGASEGIAPVRVFNEGQKGPCAFLNNGQPAGCGTKGAPSHV